MIKRILKWLFRGRDSAAGAGVAVPREAPDLGKSGRPSPVTVPEKPTKIKSVRAPGDPVDLQIGLDVGTSCTKAVLGDVEQGDQLAIPINGGKSLQGYLLPTRVFESPGGYSLHELPGSWRKRNLKIRVLQACGAEREIENAEINELVAFVALVLRRVLSWAKSELTIRHPNRVPVWHLNVGIPAGRGDGDHFKLVYRRVVGAAVRLVPGDTPITRDRIEAALGETGGNGVWVPQDRIHTFPEAGAQLASIMFSPYKPEGCLLVVDVGAGTLDVSTMRVRADETGARCVLHCCTVDNLGVHFLDLSRKGGWPIGGDFDSLLDALPDDDGVTPPPRTGLLRAPESFVSACKGVLLPTVQRYRMRLRHTHLSDAYRPWTNGLPFVLSGGGQQDPFYQELLLGRLPEWLSGIVGEWYPVLPNAHQPGLRRQTFPLPARFGPEALAGNFDRFSVAHGLSLGIDGLMDFGQAK